MRLQRLPKHFLIRHGGSEDEARLFLARSHQKPAHLRSRLRTLFEKLRRGDKASDDVLNIFSWWPDLAATPWPRRREMLEVRGRVERRNSVVAHASRWL